MRNLSKSLDTCTLQHDIDLLKASLERGLCQLGDPLRLPCKLHLYARVYDRLSREIKKKPRHLNPSVSPCSVLEIKTSLALVEEMRVAPSCERGTPSAKRSSLEYRIVSE